MARHLRLISSSQCQLSFNHPGLLPHGLNRGRKPNSSSHGKQNLTIRQSSPPAGRAAGAALSSSEASLVKWWSQTGSNRRHPACKAGALPAELWPRQVPTAAGRRPDDGCPAHSRLGHVKSRLIATIMVGLGRFELPTSRLSSARSNQLSYRPGSPDLALAGGHVFRVKKEKRRRRRPA